MMYACVVFAHAALWSGLGHCPELFVVPSAERGEDLQSTSLRGLYPAGEGAGYAGGIVSAAVDGWKVGRQIVQDITAA